MIAHAWSFSHIQLRNKTANTYVSQAMIGCTDAEVHCRAGIVSSGDPTHTNRDHRVAV